MELNNPSKAYHTTQTLVYSCQFHVIFCTKYRRKVLQDGIDERFKQLVHDKTIDYHYYMVS